MSGVTPPKLEAGTPLVELRRKGEQGQIVELAINRPTALNALSLELAEALISACSAVRADSSVRVVVLTSTSSAAFCVGADLKERHGLCLAELESLRARATGAFTGVLGLEVPTLAAVEGAALGAGLELALSCDIVVGGQAAVLGLPEVRVGMIPGAGGTQLLTRRIGWSRSALLIFTGSQLTADEGLAHGLIDVLTPAGDARRRALELARQIAANSPVAVRNAKRAMSIGMEADPTRARQAEDLCWRITAMSPDRTEGIAAFVEKRTPRWQHPHHPIPAANPSPTVLPIHT